MKAKYLLLLALFIIQLSCSNHSNYNNPKSLNSTETINVAIGELDNDGDNYLYFSSPLNITEVSICNNNCDDPTTTKHIKTLKRKFFKTFTAINLNAEHELTVIGFINKKEALKRKISFHKISKSINWKVVLMAGDQYNSYYWINAFDNARRKLKSIFLAKGISSSNIQELSLKQSYQNKEHILHTSTEGLRTALTKLNPGANDACLIHLTSHGSPDYAGGFNMGPALLRTRDLKDILDNTCADQPTVVLVSACYSGVYSLPQSGLIAPNRIILTAARHDLTSFGCSASALYTYWDTCLINALQSNASTLTWGKLATQIDHCILNFEGGYHQSYPQTFIGENVKDLLVP